MLSAAGPAHPAGADPASAGGAGTGREGAGDGGQQQGEGGEAPGGPGGRNPALSLVSAHLQLRQDMENNLRKLRQVISESQAIAQQMEQLLAATSQWGGGDSGRAQGGQGGDGGQGGGSGLGGGAGHGTGSRQGNGGRQARGAAGGGRSSSREEGVTAADPAASPVPRPSIQRVEGSQVKPFRVKAFRVRAGPFFPRPFPLIALDSVSSTCIQYHRVSHASPIPPPGLRNTTPVPATAILGRGQTPGVDRSVVGFRILP